LLVRIYWLISKCGFDDVQPLIMVLRVEYSAHIEGTQNAKAIEISLQYISNIGINYVICLEKDSIHLSDRKIT
jgi:hypothetical protein